MLVRRTILQSVISKLNSASHIAFDVETTGLYPHLGDRLFSLILHDGAEGYYFNFQAYPGLAEDWILPRSALADLAPLFAKKDCLFYAHNAKFDLAMLRYEGLEVLGPVHDTEMGARLEYNRHFSYSLDACAKRLGLAKSDAVAEYIKKHKLYEKYIDPETGEEAKKPLFTKVPFDVIAPYGIKDAEITYALGMHQLNWVKEDAKNTLTQNPNPVTDFYATELALTKVCLDMETVGIRINREFCERALAEERQTYTKAAEEFRKISGFPLVDSPKSLKKAFESVGETFGTTAKGNPSFTADVLEGMKSPLATKLLEYRSAYKKAHTYYQNFLALADKNDRIHANMRQAGTDTTRFSYSEPNLQNLNKNDDEDAAGQEFLVRRAFIPTSDYVLTAIDYQAQEYRLMLEYAGEMPVIEKVLAGLDVHSATAEMMGVTRKEAKTLNFLLLYGGGAGKLATSLGVDIEEARALRSQYFARLPKVAAFIRKVIKKADDAELIRSWRGFPLRFPYSNTNGKRENHSYKAPNHLIQGGCAQVVRLAMVRCHERLRGMKSRMLVQVHDELLFEIHKSELHVIPEIKGIMEKAFPHRHLPLLCEVKYSVKSWADMSSELPV